MKVGYNYNKFDSYVRNTKFDVSDSFGCRKACKDDCQKSRRKWGGDEMRKYKCE